MTGHVHKIFSANLFVSHITFNMHFKNFKEYKKVVAHAVVPMTHPHKIKCPTTSVSKHTKISQIQYAYILNDTVFHQDIVVKNVHTIQHIVGA